MQALSFGLVFMLLGCLASQNEVEALSQEKPPENYEVVNWEIGNSDIRAYRDKHWHPEKGQYIFTESYTYTFYNRMVQEDDMLDSTGSFTFFVDPITGTILLERYNTKYHDDMLDYFIISPDGTYHWVYNTMHDGQKLISQNSADSELLQHMTEYAEEDFALFFDKHDDMKYFGAIKYYDQVLEGTKYIRTFPRLSDTVVHYVTPTKIATRALYFAEIVNEDLTMPIPVGDLVLPDHTLTLSSHYFGPDGSEQGYFLSSISADDFHVQLPIIKDQ